MVNLAECRNNNSMASMLVNRVTFIFTYNSDRCDCKVNISGCVCTEHCLYGDYKAPFDDGTTCETKLASDPGMCYQEHYNSTCCYTCQQIRNQHSSGLSVCLSVCLSICLSLCLSVSHYLSSQWSYCYVFGGVMVRVRHATALSWWY